MKTKERGITLIALVVTIIVLLILAGISLQMLTGQSGILNQAGTARDKSGRANIIEDAQRDLLDEMTKQETEVTESMLRGVLNKYFINVPDELPDDLSTVVLTSNDGKYNDILASEIYKGAFGKIQTGERLEDMYYIEGDYNNETGEIENIKLGFTYEGLEMQKYKILYENPGKFTMTEEELELKSFKNTHSTWATSFEELMEDLYTRPSYDSKKIDKQYKTAKEYLMGEFYNSYPTEESYNNYMKRLRCIYEITIEDSSGNAMEEWGERTPINGMGQYNFTIKIDGKIFNNFVLNIGQYNIINCFGISGCSNPNVGGVVIYDFKNKNCLKIEEGRYISNGWFFDENNEGYINSKFIDVSNDNLVNFNKFGNFINIISESIFPDGTSYFELKYDNKIINGFAYFGWPHEVC